jgi:hypothetical protein
MKKAYECKDENKSKNMLKQKRKQPERKRAPKIRCIFNRARNCLTPFRQFNQYESPMARIFFEIIIQSFWKSIKIIPQ